MKSAVETLNPTRVKLTVEVPFEELKPSLDAAYKKIAQQITVPGFRKGKVPAMVIDQRVGRDVRDRRGRQRGAARALLPGAAGEQHRAAEPARARPRRGRGRRRPQLHRRARRQARDHAARRTTASRPRSTTIAVGDDEVDEQLETLRERFGSLDPGRARRCRRRLRHDRPLGRQGRRADRGGPGHRHELPGRARHHARGPRRGARSACRPATRRRSSRRSSAASSRTRCVDVTVKVTAVKEQELPDLDDEFAQTASEFDTDRRAQGRRPRPPHPRRPDRAGRRRARRRAREAAHDGRDPAARGRRRRRAASRVATRSSSSSRTPA